MRRLLSILLLAVFGLPLVSPVLALGSNDEARQPTCCRRNGKHHCLMSAAESASSPQQSPQFRSPVAKCPYAPARTTPAVSRIFESERALSLALPPSAPLAIAIRTDPLPHRSQKHSRPKRGPPSELPTA